MMKMMKLKITHNLKAMAVIFLMERSSRFGSIVIVLGEKVYESVFS